MDTPAPALALALAAALAAPAAAHPQEWGEDARDPAKITVYLLAPSAQKDLDFALALLAQGRYADALPALRPFVQRHANRVVPVEVLADGGVRQARDSRTWYGLAWYLQQYVDAQHADVRAELERFDGPPAKAQLSLAIEARDPAALLRVAREFPWTRAGADALFAAGHWAFERGDLREAAALLRRAAARPARAGDPSALAAAFTIERALGLPSEPPRDANEMADVRGVPVPLRQLSSEPTATLPAAGPEAAFAAPRTLPTDPGAIARGVRWVEALEFEPRPLEPRATIPVVAGDTVFVTNGWSLAAYELTTGRRKRGWPDLVVARGMAEIAEAERRGFVAGETNAIPLAPAVADGVVVAPLLVPLKLNDEFDYTTYNPIKVRTVFPYRKLHAFDAATGAPLWSHWRPDIARQQKDLLDQYRCPSSPVIVGERVIVPIYKVPDDASVELHLAAFSLRTGELLWDTGLLTGTRPINMFGRSLEEFYCSPPAADGDRVYLSTDLGAAACVDATTGQIHWIHRYESLPIPQSTYSQAAQRPVFWGAAPPTIDEEIVVFAPIDSRGLFAVDKRTGERIAQCDALDSTILSSKHLVRHVLGAADGLLYLAGEQLYALEMPSRANPNFRRRAASSAPRLLLSGSLPPRPLLTDRTVLVPRSTQGIAVFDRVELRQTHLIPYDAKNVENYAGNLAVAGGVVVSAGNPKVAWFFDTDAMVDAARRELGEKPNDPALRERLADYLRLRGLNQFEDKEYGASLESYREAERLYAGLGGKEAMVARLALGLAEAHVAAGETKEALAQYRRAYELSREGETRLRAALGLERSLPRAAKAERARLVEAIEKDLGPVRMPSQAGVGEIPIGLYLCIRRAEVALPEAPDPGDETPPDPAGAIAAWQEALLRFPEEFLGSVPVAVAARGKIAEVIRKHGREAYAAVEEVARRQFAALGGEPDPDDLTSLIRNYPNSLVAGSAAVTRLEALSKHDKAVEVPASAHELLLTEPSPELRARVLRAYAEAARLLGNEDLARALEDRAAGRRPSAPAPARPQGPSASLQSESYADRLEILETVRAAADDGSAGDLLFAIDRGSLYALRAASGPLGEKAWKHALPRYVVSAETGVRAAVRFPTIAIWRGTVTVAHGDYLVGLRADTGSPSFTYSLDGEVESAASAGGVFVGTARSGPSDSPTIKAFAYDAVGGALLWEADLEARGGPYLTVASPAQVVFLGLGGARPHATARFDLATGEALPALALPGDVEDSLASLAKWAKDYEREARDRAGSSGRRGEMKVTDTLRVFGERFAIYDDRLVCFVRTSADTYDTRLVALDLAAGGRRAWELAATPPSEGNPGIRLASVLYAEEEIVVLRQFNAKAGTQRKPMELVSIAPRTGEARLLSSPPAGAQIAGTMEWDAAMRWRSPAVLALTSEERATRLDFVDLKTRRTWMRSMPVRLSFEWPPAPAVGKDVVAVAYTLIPAKSGSSQSELRVFRRDNGEYAVDTAFALDGKPLALASTRTSFFVLSGMALRDVKIRRFFDLPEGPR